MSATIADVARRARVSTATVSRVLSGRMAARPETRARVLAAARDLDYRPSGIARSLKLRHTQTLGLIVTDIENPFFPQLVRAVEDAARSHGHALLLCNAVDDPEREAAYLDLLVDRRVDGVVIAARSLGARHVEWLKRTTLPVVLVNAPAPPGVELPSISSNNVAGGRLAARHLLGLGHRRIGVLSVGKRNPDAAERLAGVRSAMRAAGAGATVAVTRAAGAGVADGETAMLELLRDAPNVTAVVAYNDLMAIGAMRAVRASGRRVPDDLSVVGFDDVEVAAYVDPPLTTIRQSTSEMGRWAVERLAERLLNATNGALPERVVLPVRLEVRASTAPPRG